MISVLSCSQRCVSSLSVIAAWWGSSLGDMRLITLQAIGTPPAARLHGIICHPDGELIWQDVCPQTEKARFSVCMYPFFLHWLSFSVCLTLIFSSPLYATYQPQSICVRALRFSRCPPLVNRPNKNPGIWQSVTGNVRLRTNDCSLSLPASLSLPC